MTRKLRRREMMAYLALAAPAIILYLFAVIGPFLLGSIPASMRNWNIIKGTNEFTGLSNYIRMFTKDREFINSIWFTVKLGTGSLIL